MLGEVCTSVLGGGARIPILSIDQMPGQARRSVRWQVPFDDCMIRDGIPVVLRNAILPDGWSDECLTGPKLLQESEAAELWT